MIGKRIVSTLRADGKVYPIENGHEVDIDLNNLINLKGRSTVDPYQLNSIDSSDTNNIRAQSTVLDLGKSLLQYARDNDLKGVQQMINRGAPFVADWLGMTAIHFAAMNNHFEICETLTSGGINKDARTKVDRTALHLAAYYGHERIVELLLSKKCSLNPRDMLRMTPLHWAVEKRQKGVVRLLIKHNADVTPISKFGKSPIALAVLTEQADLLEELEAARRIQQNKKFNEEHAKETSDAVNSIMGMENSDIIDEPESTRRIDIDTDDEMITNEPTIEQLGKIKEKGDLDNTTINMLKSHGISMMQDDDDTSNNLLTTALQNGRQLVLSEGGKMLLNETRRRTVFTSAGDKTSSLQQNSASVNSNTLVPVRIKTEPRTSNVNLGIKLRPNIISKAKDGHNKEIRIISLNDFKKLYGTGNIKSLQKIPSSLNKTNVLKQIKQEPQPIAESRKMYANLRQIQNNQVIHINKLQTNDIIESGADSNDDGDLPPNIIKVGSDSDSEPPSDNDSRQQVMRVVPAGRIDYYGGNFRQVAKQTTTTTTTKAITASTVTTEIKNETSSVIPLLTVPEICRQLLDLRKQNEELRRKLDLAQREKEDIRQRLERLEGLLLIEQTEEAYSDL